MYVNNRSNSWVNRSNSWVNNSRLHIRPVSKLHTLLLIKKDVMAKYPVTMEGESISGGNRSFFTP